MKFIVTVDTEADDQWSGTGDVSVHNLEGLTRFQSFMKERGVPPTYLASYETLSHPALAELARAHHKGEAEIGGHLHPWTTPPLDEGDAVQRFPLELPDTALEAKLAMLTSALTNLLGESPRSFRAGRWGADDRVLHAIARQGYRVDSSVTPSIRWGDIIRDVHRHSATPDFSRHSPHPSMVSGTDLLEVPMSVLLTGVLPFPSLARLGGRKGFLGKVARALARPRWCRIFPETKLGDLRAVYRAARAQGLPALVFMIHSSELTPDMSPYVKDDAALERVYLLLDQFIAFLREEGVAPIRMSELRVS